MLNADIRSHGQAMFKAIKAGRYDFPSPFWDDIQPGAKDMIGCLLMLDTEKRYTAQQVKTKRSPARTRYTCVSGYGGQSMQDDNDVPEGKHCCLE